MATDWLGKTHGYLKRLCQAVLRRDAFTLGSLTPCHGNPQCPHPTQGTDARSSGHYTYTKAPDFPGPPLTCTNRARVLNWLGQLGIHNQVQEGTCILPSLSPAALLHLAEGARTVGCAWVDVR